MKRFSPIIQCLLVMLGIATHVESQTKDLTYYINNAPFKMDAVTVPQFPNKSFNINDFGAVGDGKKLNTEAIAKAISACSEAGGGLVVIPKGEWLTGPIELKSNVNLHTEDGALINFTPDHSQYPTKAGSKKQIHASPIYGNNLKNIAITGKGIFDGAGDSWRPVKKSKVASGVWAELILKGGRLSSNGQEWWPDPEVMNGDTRPHMCYFSRCENMLLEDVTLKNSPKFVFYPNYCTNITMNRVQVHNEWWAQNGDGIDISACKNVAIYQCTVNAGDDAICMKSSGKPDALDTANLANVIIAGCTVYRAHGGFVIGSNTDGGMKNIYVADCNFIGSDIGVRIKSNTGRGGWVRNVYVNNINMKNIVNDAILFDTFYEDKNTSDSGDKNLEPDFRNIYFSNIKCDGAQTAIAINGKSNMKIKLIYFENLDLKTIGGFTCKNAEDITLKHVKITCSGEPFEKNGCKNIHIIE